MRDRSQTAASIKKWLSVCDEHHTSCINASDAQSVRPTWLIDVEDQCIVQGDVPAKYIALSYTWLDVKGQSSAMDHMQLLSSNMQSMKTPDALRKDAARLPTVIKDAIELTSLLGERWLWVDRLCIVQDGPQKMSECMRMDKIYAGAYMTIAAAAQGGLFAGTRHDYGVSDGTTESTDEKIRRHYHRLKLSRWAKRAWTYQEYILSKRIVFFLDTEIFWQCEIATWDPKFSFSNQDEQAFVGTVPNSTLLRHLETPEYPDFSLYADIICPYNGRELSYQEDGLSACLGILNRLEPAFPGGFTFGLPRLYLDHALLWQPLKMSYDDVDTGRSASGRVLSDGCAPRTGLPTRRPSLPSWAWCGWQCFVDPDSLLKAFNLCQSSDQNLERKSWTLQNLVTWK
ncbi:heterokaryon incompatibility protein-domain-containing protein, partial [Fusarium flagelliforme]|uniref:heterokaryon incompatibility protein-domain-containing protein n=1 Tax=Fusarium flagelliforme TaxID=2675880 RepID=UPI001E8EEE19